VSIDAVITSVVVSSAGGFVFGQAFWLGFEAALPRYKASLLLTMSLFGSGFHVPHGPLRCPW
jgi:hypothetical protein